MSVETKDILLKAAEDVQQGMWCKGSLYEAEEAKGWFTAFDNIDVALASRRCAVGSIDVAAALLGDDGNKKWDAVRAVSERLPDHCDALADHNDNCLSDDPFEAGQQLADLFRSTAEAL